MEAEFVVRMEHITKAFAGIKALDDVSFALRPGEVHCLLGENGAGKSTLIKILSGAYQADQGEIFLSGEKVHLQSPRVAKELGIVPIYQELDLIDCLSVAENIFLCNEPVKKTGLLDKRLMVQMAQSALGELGFSFNVRKPLGEMSVAQKQMVAIAKAMSMESKVLVLDEPTDVLTGKELTVLFDIIGRIKQRGVGIIYISHRLEEIFEIGDTATVLRDGKHIATLPVKALDRPGLIRLMVGHEVTEEILPRHGNDEKPVLLEVKNLSSGRVLHNISLKLRAGEVLGISGLVGAGRTELARAIIGADPIDKGAIWLHGRKVVISSPAKARALKIGYVPEDRKRDGLVLVQSIEKNTILTVLKQVSTRGLLRGKRIRQTVKGAIKALNTKCSSSQQAVQNLSGGNQQKVVISKWLVSGAEILILDEPTRGIDVGAKAEIYEIIKDFAKQGRAIMLISSEMPELLSLSDRIVVLSEGRVTKTFDSNQAPQELLLEYAMPKSLKAGEADEP